MTILTLDRKKPELWLTFSGIRWRKKTGEYVLVTNFYPCQREEDLERYFITKVTVAAIERGCEMQLAESKDDVEEEEPHDESAEDSG